MTELTRDDVLRELIAFFLDALAMDPLGVQDFLIQGDYDADLFIEAVKHLEDFDRRHARAVKP